MLKSLSVIAVTRPIVCNKCKIGTSIAEIIRAGAGVSTKTGVFTWV